MMIIPQEFKCSHISNEELCIITKGLSALIREVKKFEKENGKDTYSQNTEKYLAEITRLYEQFSEFF